MLIIKPPPPPFCPKKKNFPLLYGVYLKKFFLRFNQFFFNYIYICTYIYI